MAWHIEKQANGLFAIWSTRIENYIVIDASPERIESIYAAKGMKVYLASARMQLAKQTPAAATGEEKIEAIRRSGRIPAEDPDAPIGATGFTMGEIEE